MNFLTLNISCNYEVTTNLKKISSRPKSYKEEGGLLCVDGGNDRCDSTDGERDAGENIDDRSVRAGLATHYMVDVLG